MLIEFEKFILGIRPHKDVLNEAMYSLTLDGRRTSLAEIKDLRKKERNSSRFWGRSDRLYEQASFFGTSPDSENKKLAEKLLQEAGEWFKAEQEVIAKAINERLGGGPNFQFEQTAVWKEFDGIKNLAILGGEPFAVMDYPIAAVGFANLGWEIELGLGTRADTDGSWNYSQGAIQVGKDLLDGKKFKIDSEYASEDIYRYHGGAKMRVHWNMNVKGIEEWKGKFYMADGTILAF
jgi:hypothetical protein